MSTSVSAQKKKLKVGVVGLTHTHVHWILGRPDRGDIEIVGIVEPNHDLAERYMKQHGLSISLVYSDLEEMLAAVKPEAVTAFGTIYEHLEVVKICAPKGIHVMVEKPLAVSLKHAIAMKKLAEQHKIHLLTNYETTWYATNHKSFEMVKADKIGPLRKIVVHDGHKGPKKIGVNKEFLDWLADPEQNGGGAITDFGCYGANLSTSLMQGVRPISVTAVTQQFQPEDYPKVDDEATIIVTYPKTQTIIQASWNWPIARKDIEIYGETGFIVNDDRSAMRYQLSEEDEMEKLTLAERNDPLDDPFAFFRAVIYGEIEMEKYDLSSLENNMIVMEILDAAVKSAKSGKTVRLK
ncbi:MAG: Gfo/Idh/MocA family oxidoreductase [Bacteroidota bacterium]